MTTLRSVAPAIAAWVVCVVVVIESTRRRPRPAPISRSLDRPRLGHLIGYVARLGFGGYAAMLSIELVFGVWIVGQDPSSLAGAVSGGALLMLVAAPSFALLSWLDGRRARSPGP